MRDRTRHMKAPSALRPDKATARGEDQVDLAASAFRPPFDGVLGNLKQARETLAELQMPVVETLRAQLGLLHEVGSLGSSEKNGEAVAMVNDLAKRCRMDLTYQREVVALAFVDDPRYRAGFFRLRALSPDQTPVYDRTKFPPLELTPAVTPDRRC